MGCLILLRGRKIDAHALPILNTLVPQVEQVPVVAGLPFFIVVDVGFLISFFALHFTQYASNF